MKPAYTISDDTINLILKKHNLGALKSITSIHAGATNPGFIINGTYVLRIDKSDNLHDVPGHKTRFEREVLLYRLLPGKNIPVPTCLGFDFLGQIIPEKYILISFIPGQSLLDSFDSCDGPTQQRISFQMGQLLRSIHDIVPSQLHDTDNIFSLSMDPKNHYEQEFLTYWGPITTKHYVTPERERQIQHVFKQFQHHVSNTSIRLRLLHGDFSPGNIQERDGTIVGVYDFEWSRVGDPLWDLQKLPINFQLGRGFSQQHFLEGYGLLHPTENEKIRVKFYCCIQGLWEIWATKTKKFPYGDDEIAEGNRLIQTALDLWP